MFSLDNLVEADRRPAPYEPGAEMWNDVYISKMMLEAHLSEDTDAASYMPSKIRAICDFLPQRMGLTEGSKIIDLGCGPGLYCDLLAKKGFGMTGLDASQNSIRYAKAHCGDQKTCYVCQSYLTPLGEGAYDAALMISEDYGVLSPENRRLLLQNIHTALKPRGYFAFDVSSLAAFEGRKESAAPKWYAVDGAGFWRGHSHFVLEKTFFYPEIPALCDLYAVLDDEVKVTRVWQTFFSGGSIAAELEEAGFEVESLYSNLWGGEYRDDAPTVGVICKKS
ncbi:Ubiquinone biosynthesis O-methyltransferase [bioreactor metagenome]|uniref:Ubiquinone biosynthesis O-methyltransferase n=1 Tax=bioreactor metagenome TaxID=1076179 RepID=A0A645A8C9_9ZZZZ